MSEFNITVDGGTSVRLPTAGKYVDRDIIVTATGSTETPENLDDVLTEQEQLIEQLTIALDNKASGGGGAEVEVVLQSKTVTPTKSTQEVMADDRYTALEKVTVEPIPSEYIVPSGTKTITENGTHDAKDYEAVEVNIPIPDGYIKPSGTLEITENGEHDVTEYASVNVRVEASGGNTEIEDAILSNTIRGAYTNDRITTLGGYHFVLSKTLTSVSFPKVTSTGTNTFQQASVLSNVSMPALARASNYMVYGCPALPKLDLPSLSAIGTASMQACSILTALILRRTTLCKLENTNALTRTPIADGTGYIYVPKALIEEYKVATNWTVYANQFRAIEDYPDICGG